MKKDTRAGARLVVRVPYTTRWGEALRLRYRWDGGVDGLADMTWTDGDVWTAELERPRGAGEALAWEYEVWQVAGDDFSEARLVRREADALRRLVLSPGTLLVSDSWTEHGIETIYRHVAFTKNLYGPAVGTPCHALPSAAHGVLSLSALPAPEGYRWGVVGSTPSLGAWDANRAVALQRTDVYEWSCVVGIAEARSGFDYKFVLINEADPSHVIWENGRNRSHPAQPDAYVALGVRILASSPRVDVPLWRGAGVVIPVFSLRSKGSWGAGDFGDLKTLVRWAAGTDMHAVQILPVNDTTRRGSRGDSYPYSGISVFALHPLYLDPREWAETELFRTMQAEGARLNDLECMDYEATYRLKHRFLLALYEQEGRRVRALRDYRDFVSRNGHWLKPYADFRAGQELGGTPAFHVFVQYLLHRQLRAAHEEARRHGVILKGDIPIGISRDSVPARVDRRLFRFDGQAGAPPDDFARDGQNWGFPTYNWEAMAEDGYAWWHRRFAHMGEYFDAYRIDHVLGFFRIWEIPASEVFGTMGHFRPALPFSEDEIRAFGFTASPAEYAEPRFDEATYAAMCAEAACPLDAYVERRGDFRILRPEYATGRAILARVKNNNVQRVLMQGVADRLFLEDADRPGLYHPRVCAQQTATFRRLTRELQDAFNRLHEDFFYVRHNEFWAAEAMRKLPPILAPKPDEETLLPCAEDLGMVPASVKGVLNALSVLSLEIQSMPKTFGRRFADLAQNPYLSVSTIATHDMPPFRLWWAQDAERAQAFWCEALGHEGTAPQEATPALCEEVVSRHLASPSMLCLLALQDWLAIDGALRRPDPDEQINVPADPNHYWRYRMHLTLDELFSATAFNEHLRVLIHNSGR